MKLKVRQIGNSRGVILPQQVVDALGEEVELTVIGSTAVLTSTVKTNNPATDDLETRAALAYANVKARRHALFTRLASQDEER